MLFSAETMVNVGNYVKKIENIFLIILDVWYLYMDHLAGTESYYVWRPIWTTTAMRY